MLATVLLTLTAILFSSCSTGNAEVYQQGVVYVVYETEGENAVPNVDVNNNGVPDTVEDAATQINAAREVFNDVFGFPDPLKSDRYPDIKAIDVVVVGRSNMKGNGVAFSGAHNKSRRDRKENVLLIKIAADLPNSNATPAHEYFHLIQYGITRFGNSWYLEGMARWSQDSINEIKDYPKDDALQSDLKNDEFEKQLFDSKYKAANSLWYPLALALNDKEKIPKRLVKKYKYADGSPVFKDDIIWGPNVMKQVLLEMATKEEAAAEEFGGQKEWRKDGRNSASNNKYILESVRAVYNSKK